MADRAAGRPDPIPSLSEEARAASLAATMAAAPAAGAIWLFAYGSLMWDPCFAYAERRAGRLAGYRRSFCFWSITSRGTPARPGLGMAVVADGETDTGFCAGLAYRLAPAERDTGLAALWAREMGHGVYRPAWVTVSTAAGTIRAITFTAEPDHAQFAGGLSIAETANHIAHARGSRGPNPDYLIGVIDCLAAHGLADPALEDLLRRIEALD